MGNFLILVDYLGNVELVWRMECKSMVFLFEVVVKSIMGKELFEGKETYENKIE